ncbi:MAG: hypothetical protein AAGJ93_06880 [Bacteroidota bacterium]
MQAKEFIMALMDSRILPVFTCLLLLFSFSCAISEPSSPEEVVSQYVQLIHEGKLDAAKVHCTPAGAAYLDALYAVMTASETVLDTLPVDVQVLNCTLSDSTALCLTKENDGFETYEASYHLQLTTEGWKIDQPTAEGETSTSEEVIESEEE